jgi:bacteriocin biosynthesis cyclodehydratase domain-containing protein
VTFEGRAVEQLLPSLLPLLDGTRTIDELVLELGPPVAPAIEQALQLLETNRLLVEGVEGASNGDDVTAAAALVAAVTRTSEAEAAQALQRAQLAVLGTSPLATEIGAQLERSGIARVDVLPFDVDPAPEAFVVAAPTGEELPSLAALNQRALALQQAWLQVLPFDGRFAVIGPLYLPGASACRDCYVLRRGACSGYEDDFDLLERFPPRAPSPAPLTSIRAALAAILSIRWVTAQDPTLPGRLYALEWGSIVRLTHHRVLRVPRCPSCGTPERAVSSPWCEDAT